jgi:hypothetical protein
LTRRLAIVGNGPVEAGSGPLIDAADLVIRFNAPQGAPERIGTRTDLLMLVNSGKSMRKWLRDPAFLGSPLVRTAHRIVLPLHPSIIAAYHPRPNVFSRMIGRRTDWTFRAVDTLGRQGSEVSVLPATLYGQACVELRIGDDRRRTTFPSTGFLGVLHALRAYPAPNWRIEICGFGWRGWKHHDWEAERRWIERRLERGELHLLRSGTDQASPTPAGRGLATPSPLAHTTSPFLNEGDG